jgi:hypothetical protein
MSRNFLEKRARSWIFVINHDTFEDLIGFITKLKAEYFCFGFEIGKEGTPHIQGYLQYKKTSVAGKFLKKIFPRAHLEPAQADYYDNQVYASKDGEFYEFGDPPKQGKRTDLISVKKTLDKTKSLKDVSEQHFCNFVRYHRGFLLYINLHQEHRTEMPIVEWIYGPTGAGKTAYARGLSSSRYIKDHTQWWDGYDQQEVIIIDDFDGRWPFRDLLRLLDRYEYQGQIKGGYVKINSKFIIITCDRSMEDLYFSKCSDHELSQLRRRITSIKHIGVTNDELKEVIDDDKNKKLFQQNVDDLFVIDIDDKKRFIF